MKKRLLTAVLTVGVVLSLVGCGSQADTSTTATAESTTEYGTEETVVEEVATEEVAETEVVEETTVEEVVEEVNPEEFPALEGDFDFISMAVDWMGKSVIVQCTETDYLTGEEKYVEYLFNRDTDVFSSINEDNLLYATMAGNESVAYVQNEDNTGFIKITDCKEAVSFFDTAQQILIQKWMMGEFTYTEGSDGVNGEYIYAFGYFQNAEGTETYKVSYFIDKETNLPFMQVISTTMPAESITVETDEALITGEEPVVREARFMYSYPVEGTEDFETFKAATTLPTDEECVTAE